MNSKLKIRTFQVSPEHGIGSRVFRGKVCLSVHFGPGHEARAKAQLAVYEAGQ